MSVFFVAENVDGILVAPICFLLLMKTRLQKILMSETCGAIFQQFFNKKSKVFLYSTRNFDIVVVVQPCKQPTVMQK